MIATCFFASAAALAAALALSVAAVTGCSL
jgi:hypothetical protein